MCFVCCHIAAYYVSVVFFLVISTSPSSTRTDTRFPYTMRCRSRNLLPHEYTHSWDGKYRRGKDLWTPDYRMPMQNSLLWVYEGQTQFWGYVLDARSGDRKSTRLNSSH